MKMHRTPAVYQLHNFSISFFYPLPQEDSVSVKLDNSASGYSVVAHDNKVDQAMALVQKHVMVAIKEEVHILQKHVRELTARNLLLEHENSLLRTLTNGSQSQHEMDNNTQKQMFNTQIHRNATNSPNP